HRQRRPGGEGGPRRGDRAVHVGRVAGRHGVDDLFGGRVDDVEGVGGGGRRPGAVDVEGTHAGHLPRTPFGYAWPAPRKRPRTSLRERRPPSPGSGAVRGAAHPQCGGRSSSRRAVSSSAVSPQDEPRSSSVMSGRTSRPSSKTDRSIRRSSSGAVIGAPPDRKSVV